LKNLGEEIIIIFMQGAHVSLAAAHYHLVNTTNQQSSPSPITYITPPLLNNNNKGKKKKTGEKKTTQHATWHAADAGSCLDYFALFSRLEKKHNKLSSVAQG